MTSSIENYLESTKKQFDYYKLLGDKTFAQLTAEELSWQANEESNSITIIIKHLHGNMLSRWTNFLTEDGEKNWRKRDDEFEDTLQGKEAILAKWEEAWSCLFEALEGINEDNFEQIIYIRNMGHSITEAINRQMMHYAYHIGQITFIGKMLKGKNWQSLSVPKGQSKIYNQSKFAEEKRRAHFTEEFLEE